jgi:nicotinamide phosphoribosyltransferase
MNMMHSYFESRGGDFPFVKFFSLQYYLKEYLSRQIKKEDVDYAEKRLNAAVGCFNREGWDYIVDKHDGYIPVEIYSVPEGSVVPTKTPLVVVRSTDENCAWIVNYIESLLSQIWSGCTVCTQSYVMKQQIRTALDLSGDVNTDQYRLVDFGLRGVSSVETAAKDGCAHLANFMVTDNMPAIEFAYEYYDCEEAGKSIDATEHSVMTITGKDNEKNVVKRVLEIAKDKPVSIVIDSYNDDAFVREILPKFKELIVNRTQPLFLRPDSGFPPEVVRNITKAVMDKFGYIRNQKGYKELPPYLRIIQGDGIDINSIPQIYEECHKKGYSSNNYSFGSGGGLLQKVNRDTQKFAFKLSAAKLGDKYVDVYKDPRVIGKKSKKGEVWTYFYDGKWHTGLYNKDAMELSGLHLVFENGKLHNETTLDKVRAV